MKSESFITSTSVGSIIMAIGIFTLYALQNLPFNNLFVTRLITLELLIIWCYITSSILALYLNGGFTDLIRGTNNKLGIGTWVAGTAVLGILFLKEFPSFFIVIYALVLLALSLWVTYLWLVFRNLQLILFKKIKIHSGIILLSVVSTQSIVLLINSLFYNNELIYLNYILIILGFLFYLVGLIIIVKYFYSLRMMRLILSWSNNNSIIHGALSISGLACLVVGTIENNFINLIWLVTTLLFLLVEGMSLIKIYYRIKISGFMNGACLYHMSQWSRNFTYGMYYAFTVSAVAHHLSFNLVASTVSKYGQYIVLFMLLIEIFLFLRHKLI
jgi:hypothetical protein